MALPDNALTTVAAACRELSLSEPASGSTDEADWEARIGAASDAIEGYCGREFAKWTGTEKVPGHGTDCLFLSRAPVLSVSAVTYDGETVPAEDYDATPEPKDARAGLLRRSVDAEREVWEWTARCVPGASGGKQAGTERSLYAVTYSAGYVLPKDDAPGNARTLPYDVERACLLTVAAGYRGKGRDSSIISETIMDSTQTRAAPGSHLGTSGLPLEAERLLSRYRRVS